MTRPLPLPELSPRPDELSRALSRMHARRLRSAFVGATSATAAVVAMAVLTAGGGTATDSLRPVEPAGRPTVTSSAGVVVTSTASPPAVSPTRAAGPTTSPRAAAAAPSDGPVSLPTSLVSPSRRPASSYAPSPTRGRRQRPTMTRTYTQPELSPSRVSSGYTCSSGEVGGREDEWCVIGFANPAGDGYDFGVAVCRNAVHRSAASLNYETVKEADLAVVSTTGRELWRWSAGQTFARSRHSLSLDPGACYRWAIRWDAVLDSGKRLPPGRYSVIGSSASAQVRATTRTDFQA